MTLDEALTEFCTHVIRHHQASLLGDSAAANTAASRFDTAFGHIKSHGPSGLAAFFELMKSDHTPVKAMAAGYSLHYRTEEALATLHDIASHESGILGLAAEQAIHRWEEGAWNIR